MDILEYELVRKYFYCTTAHYRDPTTFALTRCFCIAEHVLKAMQEPIRKGERYLALYPDKTFHELVNDHRDITEPYFGTMRLPDRFQPEKKRATCMFCDHPLESSENCPNRTQPPSAEKCDCSCHRKDSPYRERSVCNQCAPDMEHCKPWKGTDRMRFDSGWHDLKNHECDEMEKKIREIMWTVKEHGNVALESQLRELVELARKNLDADWLTRADVKIIGFSVSQIRKAINVALSVGWKPWLS